MTVIFVNPTPGVGNDANNGLTELTPVATLNRARQLQTVNGNHQILARRGTTQRLTAVHGNFRSGDSAAAPFTYGVYGPEKDGPFTLTADSNIGDLMYILSNENFVHIEDYVFDGNGIVTRPFQVQADIGNTNGIVLRRCVFRRGPAVGSYVENKNSALRTLSVTFEDCLHENNGSHGFYARGAMIANVRRCEARYNGAIVQTGGHGFSAQSELQTFTTGWSGPVSGVWSRAFTPAQALKVTTTLGTFEILANAGATTTPAAGQYGLTGGVLYINIGAGLPNTLTVNVMTSPSPTLTYEDCVAHHNIQMPLAIFREGHGFAADDFASSRFLRCVSYDNDGAGFSLNAGDGSVVESCVAYDNKAGAVAILRGRSNAVRNNTFLRNDLLPHHNAQVVLQGGSVNNNVSNNIISGGGTRGVFADVTSASNTVATNCINGPATAVVGVTDTGTITADPRPHLNGDLSLRVPPGATKATIAADNPLALAGTYIPGVRLRNGRARPGWCPVGAYQAVLPRAARAA